METQLREANENIRVLQSDVETKSAALSHEKSDNAASQSTIDRMRTEFEEKMVEREESLKKMFMRNWFFNIYLLKLFSLELKQSQ